MIQSAGLVLGGLGVIVYVVGVVALRPLAGVAHGLIPRLARWAAGWLVGLGLAGFLFPLIIGLVLTYSHE